MNAEVAKMSWEICQGFHQLLLASFIVLISAEAVHSGLLRIIGGQNASLGEYPFAVSLQTLKTKENEHYSKFCGGSIIDESWVLTAAHCVEEKQYEGDIYARAGIVFAFDNNTNSQLRKVVEVVINSDYDRENHYANDIALLRVEPPFKFNFYVQPIELPEEPVEEYNGTGTIIGWGYLKDDDSGIERTTELHDAKIAIRTLESCKEYLHVTEKNICIGGFGSDTASCKGDSGAPLVKYKGSRPIVIGLDSFGKKGCGKKPTAYTNISQFLDFIGVTLSKGYISYSTPKTFFRKSRNILFNKLVNKIV